MGSRCREVPLAAGDLLPAEPATIADRWTPLGRIAAEDSPVIRYLDGPEADLIAPATLERAAFTLGPQSDRMGLRLEGPRWNSPPIRTGSPRPCPPGRSRLPAACRSSSARPAARWEDIPTSVR